MLSDSPKFRPKASTVGCFHFFDPHDKGAALARELAEGGQAPALLFQQSIRTLKRQVIALSGVR
jgi:hypothetical protein